ncbi:hypothetical protein RU90_GL000709 [Lactococcus lactis subsp. hordniae]|uniref:Uncharacterized protein n=1 Tax=Lactococcus lactis subsp. hordniae TaxID=203404 RepID=A0A2A5SD81_LACLH|nr:hypothetical protein RU90_GL000709 [Lactococcus lactis subsp. hordniae]
MSKCVNSDRFNDFFFEYLKTKFDELKQMEKITLKATSIVFIVILIWLLGA